LTKCGCRDHEEDHQLAKQSTGLDAGQVIRWRSWHRWTAICLLAYTYLAVAVAIQRQQEAGSDLDAGLIPITVPELLRLLRDTVIPPPRRDKAHRLHWSTWRRRHQHRARQAHLSFARTMGPGRCRDLGTTLRLLCHLGVCGGIRQAE
jgi:hypothetical protein